MTDCEWYFGHGSNMNIKDMKNRKNVTVIESAPAILKDFRIEFSYKGYPRVEPAYGDLWESPGSEVHGLASYLDKKSAKNLDYSEGVSLPGGYKKEKVTFTTYAGKSLEGYIYINRNPDKKVYLPSKKYLNILIAGAKDIGLDSKYIAKLEAQPFYVPSEKTLKARLQRPKPEDLPVITLDELSKKKLWTSVLGYVCKPEKKRYAHRGKELTQNGTDLGKPYFPLIKEMNPDELEYMEQWLDNYSLNENDELLPFVGYLKEFHERQVAGTSFVIP